MNDKASSDIKFILDVHLGKLAKYLRLFGFDAFCDLNLDDGEIIRISLDSERIILTRDKELLKSRDVVNGYRVISQDPDEQLLEVFRRFELKRHINPFTRCLECNGLLGDVSKEEITHLLNQRTLEFYYKFKMCPGCGRVYWEGSHYERMRKYIDSVINDVN